MKGLTLSISLGEESKFFGMSVDKISVSVDEISVAELVGFFTMTTMTLNGAFSSQEISVEAQETDTPTEQVPSRIFTAVTHPDTNKMHFFKIGAEIQTSLANSKLRRMMPSLCGSWNTFFTGPFHSGLLTHDEVRKLVRESDADDVEMLCARCLHCLGFK